MYAILGPDRSVSSVYLARHYAVVMTIDIFSLMYMVHIGRLLNVGFFLVEATFKWRLLPSTPYPNGLAAWRRQISLEARLCFGLSKGGGWAPADNIIFGFVT